VAFVPSRQQLGQGDPPSVPAQRSDALDRPINLFLPAMRLGHQPGNGAAVAVMMIVSPRSTSSRSRGRWVLASEAWISRMMVAMV
jgi:hypothetical protein